MLLTVVQSDAQPLTAVEDLRDRANVPACRAFPPPDEASYSDLHLGSLTESTGNLAMDGFALTPKSTSEAITARRLRVAGRRGNHSQQLQGGWHARLATTGIRRWSSR